MNNETNTEKNGTGERTKIVPDGFDWDAARAAPSSTPDDQRKRCPECESKAINPRAEHWGNQRPPDAQYQCMACGADFEYPVGGPPP
jgi:DNA-directed RNA polymerase subunit RPC12/RpoP